MEERQILEAHGIAPFACFCILLATDLGSRMLEGFASWLYMFCPFMPFAMSGRLWLVSRSDC